MYGPLHSNPVSVSIPSSWFLLGQHQCTSVSVEDITNVAVVTGAFVINKGLYLWLWCVCVCVLWPVHTATCCVHTSQHSPSCWLLSMVKHYLLSQWCILSLTPQSHSLHSLRLLSGALHAAILTTLQHDLDTPTPYHFVVQDSAVFNALVTSCFQQVPTCLHHHFPHTSSSSTPTKPRLPSSQTSWSKIRRTVKQYLFDLLSLAGALQDADMQHAVLKQVHSMAAYFASLPKLLKPLNKYLLEKWSNGEGRVQVLAFLALRKVLLYQAHPALHTLLKVLLSAY